MMKVGPVRRLTTDGCFKQNPCFSPDGKQIVFSRHYDDEFSICVMNADGTNFRQITEHRGDKVPQYHPDWSPDGKKIVYTFFTFAGTDGTEHIQTMTPEGKNIERIVSGTQFNQHPIWSPDSKKVAFCSMRDGHPEIYVVDADGKNIRRVTQTANPINNHHPSWSQDGSRIAFDSDRDGNFEIYTMDADGKNVHRLTEHPSADESPRWSPDGKHIAFTTFRDGN